MADMTYCTYGGCPFEDCERHPINLNGKDGIVSLADFAPVCRRYIAHVVEEVADDEP